MRKLQLELQDLQVETFEVASHGHSSGTVAAFETGFETGYTVDRCGGCYSEGGAGMTCGCQSYETCTQDPNAMECYSDHHSTACGRTCIDASCVNSTCNC
jgi:hypothetical protein